MQTFKIQTFKVQNLKCKHEKYKNGITDACSTADCCPLLSLLTICPRCCPRHASDMPQMMRQMMPFHRLPRTATADWPKCFCIYRLKCSKGISPVVPFIGKRCKTKYRLKQEKLHIKYYIFRSYYIVLDCPFKPT